MTEALQVFNSMLEFEKQIPFNIWKSHEVTKDIKNLNIQWIYARSNKSENLEISKH